MPCDHSEITAYVNEGDVARIARALTSMAASEGRQPVAEPQRKSIRYILEPSDRWNFALLPGAPGWTVVHAQPWNVLCYPSPTGSRRFIDLCAALGVRGFVVDTVDEGYHGQMLVETDGHGRERLSGWYFPPDGGDPSYHGTPLNLDKLRGISFEICADLECANLLSGGHGSLDMDTCREIAIELGGENGETFWSSGEDFSGAWDEMQHAMSTGGPMLVSNGAVLQFQAAHPSGTETT